MLQGNRTGGHVLIAAGLWLLLSPFVLFSQTSLSTGLSTEATLVSMSMGFLALGLAGLYARYQGWVSGTLGIGLGIATMGGPWMFGYADHIMAALNASITGGVITSIAVAEISSRNRRGHS